MVDCKTPRSNQKDKHSDKPRDNLGDIQSSLNAITWYEGEPYSTRFGDNYFTKNNGWAESCYVFLDHNDLMKRFTALKKDELFTIGETGFGTGLNFLTTASLFLAVTPQQSNLHFLSAEKYPLTYKEIKKALANFPQLEASLKEEFLNQYHGLYSGFQTLVLAQGRITLTLMIGDVNDTLPQIKGRVDAWFLDGFSPSKNPEMWQTELFSIMVSKSSKNTTFATFTASSFVRRGLIEAGFTVYKTKGFGNKREMLYGELVSRETPSPSVLSKKFDNERAKKEQIKTSQKRREQKENPPWYNHSPHSVKDNRVFVIGAGLAGAATAYLLAINGYHVTVLEKNNQIANEGSGNPEGILYLKLSPFPTLQTRFLLEGFGYTLRLLRHLSQKGKLTKGDDWDNCGVLQLSYSQKETIRNQKLSEAYPPHLLKDVSQEKTSQLANIPLSVGGVYFPSSGWVKPRRLCQALLDHPNITVELNCQVNDIYPPYYLTDNSLSSITNNIYNKARWLLETNNKGSIEANTVILANATASTSFTVSSKLPLKNIRGQITFIPYQNRDIKTASSLKTVVCTNGYIIPTTVKNGSAYLTLGATFDFTSEDQMLSLTSHQENIKRLKNIAPQFAHNLNIDKLSLAELKGRVAFRSTTPDYLPLVGPLADFNRFIKTYAPLEKDINYLTNKPCPLYPGLYINAGHGSRGLITAPLSAQVIVDHLHSHSFSVEKSLVEALHPNRFYLRWLRFPERREKL